VTLQSHFRNDNWTKGSYCWEQLKKLLLLLEGESPLREGFGEETLSDAGGGG